MRKIAIEPGFYYHIYNRGVSKQKIFHEAVDYERFEVTLKKLKNRYELHCEAYCFMPNHYHLMLIDKGKHTSTIPNFMHALQMSYAKYYNHKYDHSGAVFQGTYKAKLVECEESEEKIKEYIKMNPVVAGLVEYSADWPFSGEAVQH